MNLTIIRIDEILAEYQAKKAELLAHDFTAEVEEELNRLREKMLADRKAELDGKVRDVDISIQAVQNVKQKLLLEEE